MIACEGELRYNFAVLIEEIHGRSWHVRGGGEEGACLVQANLQSV